MSREELENFPGHALVECFFWDNSRESPRVSYRVMVTSPDLPQLETFNYRVLFRGREPVGGHVISG